jgi:hypothetical protein
MGLFSSKKKHFVDSAVVRVIEDRLLPDTLAASVAEAVLGQGDPSISGTIIENLLFGNWRNFEKAYRYALKPDGYTEGTPDVVYYSSDVAKSLVAEPVATDYGTVQSIEYALFKPLNNFFMAYKKLYEELDYCDTDLASQATANSFKPDWVTPARNGDKTTPLVYLEKIVVQHDSPPGQGVETNALGSPEGRLSKEGQVPRAVELERAAQLSTWDAREEVVLAVNALESFELHAVWEERGEGVLEGDGILKRSSKYFSLTDYDEDAEYFQVKAIKRQQQQVTVPVVAAVADGVPNAVQAIFKKLLGRFPALSGQNYWTEAIRNNQATYADLDYSIRQSSEFIARWAGQTPPSTLEVTENVRATLDYWATGYITYRNTTQTVTVNKPVYFVYKPGGGRFPNLDNFTKTPAVVENGEFFPFIIFRQNGQNRAANTNTEQFKTTEKLCDILGFDYTEVSESIHENPDIENVRQAVMTCAVPITTQDPIQLEYLFLHFNDLIERIGYQDISPAQFDADNLLGPAVAFAAQYTDGDFSMRVSFDGIERRIKVGDIGPVGTYTNGEETFDFQEDLGNFGTNIFIGAGASLSNKARILKRQLYPGIYEEIRIDNPQYRYEVFEDKGVEGGKDDERLLIPINMRLVKDISLTKREKLYAMSLNLVFNSHVVQTVKWYQRGAFAALLIVIAVVISLYDKGITLKWVPSSFAPGGTTAAITIAILLGVIGEVIVIAKLVQLGFKELSKAVGADIAVLLAVVAIAYGSYNYVTDSTAIFDITPMQFIDAASNLVENAIALEFEDLTLEAAELEKYKEEKLELLEEAQELLGNPLDINPLIFVYREPMNVLGEPPEGFYGRTLNANPGVTSLEFVQNFYDVSLRLPT